VTAAHLVDRVLPHVPYRQWTLSFPHRVRWVLLKDVGLLSDVLTLFLRAVFALQRRRARRQGLRGGQVGAVSFIQFFGSALQVTPHFHSLVPDGVFVPGEGGVRFEALPPPTQGFSLHANTHLHANDRHDGPGRGTVATLLLPFSGGGAASSSVAT
jgi:putative transposase